MKKAASDVFDEKEAGETLSDLEDENGIKLLNVDLEKAQNNKHAFGRFK